MALLRPLSALSRKGYGPLMSLAEVTCAVEILCTPLILPQKVRSQVYRQVLQVLQLGAGPSGLLPSKTHPTCAQLLHIRVLCLAHEAAAYCMLDCFTAALLLRLGSASTYAARSAQEAAHPASHTSTAHSCQLCRQLHLLAQRQTGTLWAAPWHHPMMRSRCARPVPKYKPMGAWYGCLLASSASA